MLRYNSPFLQLGPYKLEPLSLEPYVAVVRELHSSAELEDIMAGARGRMKATPLNVGNEAGRSVVAYTQQRTSKVAPTVSS